MKSFKAQPRWREWRTNGLVSSLDSLATAGYCCVVYFVFNSRWMERQNVAGYVFKVDTSIHPRCFPYSKCALSRFRS